MNTANPAARLNRIVTAVAMFGSERMSDRVPSNPASVSIIAVMPPPFAVSVMRLAIAPARSMSESHTPSLLNASTIVSIMGSRSSSTIARKLVNPPESVLRTGARIMSMIRPDAAVHRLHDRNGLVEQFLDLVLAPPATGEPLPLVRHPSQSPEEWSRRPSPDGQHVPQGVKDVLECPTDPLGPVPPPIKRVAQSPRFAGSLDEVTELLSPVSEDFRQFNRKGHRADSRVAG